MGVDSLVGGSGEENDFSARVKWGRGKGGSLTKQREPRGYQATRRAGVPISPGARSVGCVGQEVDCCLAA